MVITAICPHCNQEIQIEVKCKTLQNETEQKTQTDLHQTQTTMPDEIENSIISDGYIPNTNLWRRWIMAQMLRNYRDKSGNSTFDKHFISGSKYKYAWETTLNEMKALSHLTGKELNKRERFFNLNVTKEMANEYYLRLKKVIATLPVQKRGNTEFKHIPWSNQNIYYSNESNFWNKIERNIENIQKADNYPNMVKALKTFMKECPLTMKMPKPEAWKNAFKGAGAYYTMDNMIKFHNCKWFDYNTNKFLSIQDSIEMLEKETNQHKNEYYKLYAIMRDFVKYNNFDFEKRMEEIYSENNN